MIHRWVTGLLAIAAIALIITSVQLEVRIVNIERQLIRVETDYEQMVREAKQLTRVNEMNLLLLARGGWDYDVPVDSTGD